MLWEILAGLLDEILTGVMEVGERVVLNLVEMLDILSVVSWEA